MPDGEISLVCFDLGGVVVRICRSLREACEIARLPYHPDADTPELRQARRAVSQRHTVGELEDGVYYREMAAHTAGRYTPQDIQRIDAAWIVDPYPGIESVVDALNAASDLTTGCLSNTTREHWLEMAHVDERERRRPGEPRFPAVPKMEHRAASHLLGLAKPELEIYRTYEQLAGIPSERILFFDDTAENIEAARRAGWNAEPIEHTGDTAAQVRALLARYGIGLDHLDESRRGGE